MKTLRLILGDQLNHQHSWYDQQDKDIWYVLMEMRQETDYVRHHIQKVTAFFAAMRAFAEHLKKAGHQVIYLKLDDKSNQQDLIDNLEQIIADKKIERFEYQLPDEYRLNQQLKKFCESTDLATEAVDSEHFITSRSFLREFFAGKKTYLMESFYRQMRKDHDLLMDGDEPVGGQWNYDQDNRKKLPAKHTPVAPKLFDQDVSELVQLIREHGVETIGKIEPEHFIWPTTREQSQELLEFFAQECLENFGRYQDAMTPDYWSLYHSRLSFSLNSKLLHPLEVVHRCIQEWEKRKEEITLSQIEGFVRQIIGWREYMRGVYWAHMPGYAEKNFLEHNNQLPDYFWTGDTKMACVSHAVTQSLTYAYAHHIQRLMVTGNFALLAGIDPDELDQWYLGIYIDAIQWVEITNTRGMSQFADGGIVGTKPYVSSANYMHKMSHYCKGCHYNYKDKTGEKACPFNSLYWHFYNRHEDKLSNNPRIGMAYRLWDRMDSEKKAAILERGEWVMKHLEEL